MNSSEEFDERWHLTYSHVAVDDRVNPSWAWIRVKFSKTDGQGSVLVPRARAGWNVSRLGAVTIPCDTSGGARPVVPVPQRRPSDTTAIGSRDAGSLGIPDSP